MQRLMLGSILLCLSACGTGGVHQMKNGNLRVQCPQVQSECMHQAELHCQDRGGVHVLNAREKNELYGVEGNKAGTLVSEVVFVCGDDAPRKPIKLPPREESTTSTPSPTPEKRICIPGSTQRCVGPAACVGGQSCLPSGTGWANCECSPQPAPASEAGTAEPATGDGSAPSTETMSPDSAESPPASERDTDRESLDAGPPDPE